VQADEDENEGSNLCSMNTSAYAGEMKEEGEEVNFNNLENFGIKMEPDPVLTEQYFEALMSQTHTKVAGGKWRKKHKELYHKVDGQWRCNNCDSSYDSNHGIYYHLKHTKCGFGYKTKSKPKKDWSLMYRREAGIFICQLCDKNYETIRGVHYHLRKTVCGEKEDMIKEMARKQEEEGKIVMDGLIGDNLPENGLCLGQPGWKLQGKKGVSGPNRKNYKQFYRKEDETSICLSCDSKYYSIHGMHNHLNNTRCGFGDKFVSRPKTSYLDLYHKESENKFVCLGCKNTYNSMHGLHYHLNRTRCGFGHKETMQTKRNYLGLYKRTEDIPPQFSCNACGFTMGYLTGIHRHLKECVATITLLQQGAAMNMTGFSEGMEGENFTEVENHVKNEEYESDKEIDDEHGSPLNNNEVKENNDNNEKTLKQEIYITGEQESGDQRDTFSETLQLLST